MGLMEQGLAPVEDELRPGQQQCFLDVPGVEQASAFSVGDWDAIERMGAPVQIEIELTHPQRISRKHFLNRDATFIMAPQGGEHLRQEGRHPASSEARSGRSARRLVRPRSSTRVAIERKRFRERAQRPEFGALHRACYLVASETAADQRQS